MSARTLCTIRRLGGQREDEEQLNQPAEDKAILIFLISGVTCNFLSFSQNKGHGTYYTQTASFSSWKLGTANRGLKRKEGMMRPGKNKGAPATMLLNLSLKYTVY